MTKKYTEQQEEELKRLYIEKPTAETVDFLAKLYNVPIRSIIAKLSHFNIYKAKKYVNKLGQLPIKKADLVQKLSGHFQDYELEQIEKLSKLLIQKLIQKLILDPKSEI
jgi:hypothetical protein